MNFETSYISLAHRTATGSEFSGTPYKVSEVPDKCWLRGFNVAIYLGANATPQPVLEIWSGNESGDRTSIIKIPASQSGGGGQAYGNRATTVTYDNFYFRLENGLYLVGDTSDIIQSTMITVFYT